MLNVQAFWQLLVNLNEALFHFEIILRLPAFGLKDSGHKRRANRKMSKKQTFLLVKKTCAKRRFAVILQTKVYKVLHITERNGSYEKD